MPACSFCKENYEIPRGLTLILNDGKILSFCSKKCQRNHELKRDPKKTNWVRRDKKVAESKEKAAKVEKPAKKATEEKKTK